LMKHAKLSVNGDCTLFVTTDCVQLLDKGSKRELVSWPFSGLRRYGVERNMFSLEAGRACATGDGIFLFDTEDPEAVYQCIHDAAQRLARSGGSASQSSSTSNNWNQMASPKVNNIDQQEKLQNGRVGRNDSRGGSEMGGAKGGAQLRNSPPGSMSCNKPGKNSQRENDYSGGGARGESIDDDDDNFNNVEREFKNLSARNDKGNFAGNDGKSSYSDHPRLPLNNNSRSDYYDASEISRGSNGSRSTAVHESRRSTSSTMSLDDIYAKKKGRPPPRPPNGSMQNEVDEVTYEASDYYSSCSQFGRDRAMKKRHS